MFLAIVITFVVALIAILWIDIAAMVEYVDIMTAGQESEKELDLSGDCIIVLAHFLLPDGRPASEFIARLDRCIYMWEMRKLPIIIHGGHTHGAPISQFDAAVEYLERHGIAPYWIFGGVEGADTLDEVRLAIEVMRQNDWSKPIVTSNRLHLRQAFIAFVRQGIEPMFHATKLVETGFRYRFTRFLVLLPTYLDPTGKNPVFRFIRWSRNRLFGSRI